jgi:hypothetical protein
VWWIGKKKYNFDMCMRELSENCSGVILCMERKKIKKKGVSFAKYLTRIFAGRYWWFGKCIKE